MVGCQKGKNVWETTEKQQTSMLKDWLKKEMEEFLKLGEY